MEKWIFLALIVCIITGVEAANMKYLSKKCSDNESLSLIISFGFENKGISVMEIYCAAY